MWQTLVLLSVFIVLALGQGEDCTTPDNNQGRCQLLNNCPSLLTVYQNNPRSQEVVDYLIGSQRRCGTRSVNRMPIVCCRSNGSPSAPAPAPAPAPQPQPQTGGTGTKCVEPNGAAGTCIGIKTCPAILNEFIARQKEPEYVAYIKRSSSICRNIEQNICCPSAKAATPNGTPTTGAAAGPVIQTPAGPPRLITPEEGCGYTKVQHTRIVGGEPAKLGAWPWMALIGYKDSFGETSFKCGGSLISKRHVLTAAHCLRSDLASVRLGEHDLSTSAETTHIDVPITRVEKYPTYDKKDGHSDLAVLVMENDVEFNTRIVPICIPVNNPVRTKSFEGYTPFVAGWGRTQEGGSSANILQELQVPVLTNGECEKRYAAVNKRISDKQFDSAVLCAGYIEGGKDSCQGDSGGPLMAPQQIKGNFHFYQIGIVSYGIGCARVDVPGVYASVQTFVDWINEKVAEAP